MASFPNLWPHRPSDSSEGYRTFRDGLVAAALFAAHAIASALAELATPGSHAVRSLPTVSTGTGLTPQSATLSVGTSVLVSGGGSNV
jgi:hypothetical protein